YDLPPTLHGERPPFCDMHSDIASTLRPLRLLFVGEAWKGSSARSMREALESLQAAAVSEVDPGHYFPSIAQSPCVERTVCRVRCNVRSWSPGSLNFSEC